jgi:hypothetical protein
MEVHSTGFAELAKTCVAALFSSFRCVGEERCNHDVICETDHLA